MSKVAYRICSRCVMDTSDPQIVFDDEGVCDHCHRHAEVLATAVFSGEEGQRRLQPILDRIKREGRGKPYDCVIGVSGGVDSTYTAWLAKELGLRPLAVHLDNGWNSEIAVRNISNTIQRLGIDLYTHVIDWEEFRDIQRAFLLASVADVEVPSDHAINSCLMQMAAKHGLNTVISGANPRTESHLPAAWSRGHWDYGYIHDVHRKFGTGRTKTYPHMSFADYLSWRQCSLPMLDILSYVEFSREKALELIERELGWRDYGGKHHESIFTRWYQGCYLPRKFGYDKRRSHLSSLISCGQLTREAALAELQPPPYDERLQDEDTNFVAKKLGFTRAELDAIMQAPPARFEDFHSYDKVFDSGPFKALRAVRRAVRNRTAAQPLTG
ncbi:MAG TPA: N-acetyl sugar amidotransferase [Caulobacteraceae bacterium]